MSQRQNKSLMNLKRVYNLLKENPSYYFSITDIKNEVIGGSTTIVKQYIEMLLYFNLIEKIYLKEGCIYYKVKDIHKV